MTTRVLRASFTVDEGPIEELSRIVLTESVLAGDGMIPSGSSGTVVSVYAGGEAYCVEFSRPFHALVDVGASQLLAIPEATRERLIANASATHHRSEED